MDERIDMIFDKLKKINEFNFLRGEREVLEKELNNLFQISNVNLDDFNLNDYSVKRGDNKLNKLIFNSENKNLEVYYDGRYNIHYKDDDKDVTALFSLDKNYMPNDRGILYLKHSNNGDYLYYSYNSKKFRGESFVNDGMFDVMYSSVWHYDNEFKGFDNGKLFDGLTDLKEFVVPSNYSVSDLSKVIYYFDKNPQLFMDTLNYFPHNVNYISYDGEKVNKNGSIYKSMQDSLIYEMGDNDLDYIKNRGFAPYIREKNLSNSYRMGR